MISTNWRGRTYVHATTAALIDRLDASVLSWMNVIRWGCPVPSFGDPSSALLATVGLNPSSREFVDASGNELEGSSRRFHTLQSLGLNSWADIDARHIRLILDSYHDYFSVNPYDRWFRRLDQIISGTQMSYYSNPGTACHLDLIPYATQQRWSDLSPRQQISLFGVANDALGRLVQESDLRVLILNGQSVVAYFQQMAGVSLERRQVPAWSLPRSSQSDVMGMSYSGFVKRISGYELNREVLVLGFNHNIQSSFGVSKSVTDAIQTWITESCRSALA